MLNVIKTCWLLLIYIFTMFIFSFWRNRYCPYYVKSTQTIFSSLLLLKTLFLLFFMQIRSFSTRGQNSNGCLRYTLFESVFQFNSVKSNKNVIILHCFRSEMMIKYQKRTFANCKNVILIEIHGLLHCRYDVFFHRTFSREMYVVKETRTM